MNRIPKQRYISIFVRLLVLFFLVTIPLYVISIYANKKGADNVKEQIARSTMYQVTFYLRDFESEVQRITEMQARYIDDLDFKQLSLLGPALDVSEQVRSLNGIRNKLLLLQSTSKYVESITAYIPSMEMTIDSSGYMQECCTADELSVLFRTTSPKLGRIHEGLLLNQISTYILSDEERIPAYGISARLSEERIQRSLLDFIQYDRGSALLMSHADRWTIQNCSDDLLMAQSQDFFRRHLEAPTGIGNISVEGQPYLVVRRASPQLRLSLLVFIPETEFLRYLESYGNWMKLTSVVTAIVLVAFSIWLYRLMEQPLVELVHAFRKVESGDMSVEIAHDGNDEFTYLYRRFNKMVRNLKSSMERAYEQEIRAKNAELKQLQYQINPHFLYNSIFIIYRMTKRGDISTIEKLSRHLGEYYRFVTRSSANEIPLQDEIDHACNYIEVQRIRFGRRIAVEVGDIPEGREQVIVPRLVVQPLIENSYNHGLKNKEADGLISLSMEEEGGMMFIRVDDNGDDLPDADLNRIRDLVARTDHTMENTGIVNIHRRLVITYGEHSGIDVARSAFGGLSVALRIPLAQE